MEIRDGEPDEKCVDARRAGYADSVPRRHKHDPQLLKKLSASGNANVPDYSVYYDAAGRSRHYTYYQCRWFYCTAYEHLASKQACFAALMGMLGEGISLQIVGYDGYDVGVDADKDELWQCYNDTSRPFGHELVLLSMLRLRDPRDYPWNVERSRNAGLYAGFGL